MKNKKTWSHTFWYKNRGGIGYEIRLKPITEKYAKHLLQEERKWGQMVEELRKIPKPNCRCVVADFI